MMDSVKKNSLKAWVLATRPKTLSAGIIPVVVACALAFRMGTFKLRPALLCLMFALLAQIASNFSNDYFDYKKNTDNEDRLGPARAVASGWISPKRMLFATFLVIFLACFFGLGLLPYGGLSLLWVGLACVVSLLAYTAGPWPLAYHGLGDVFVFVFFGLIAVVYTYMVQSYYFEELSFYAGCVVGFQQVNILVLNNYRDRDNDKASGKNTTVVLFGEVYGRRIYLINGIFSCLIALNFIELSKWAAFLPFLYLIPHYITWKKMCRIGEGRLLNPLLGETSRNLLLLGFLVSLGFLLR
jgi:1,4-dihydroxy-2-naphthoate polyprenyltransferase